MITVAVAADLALATGVSASDASRTSVSNQATGRSAPSSLTALSDQAERDDQRFLERPHARSARVAGEGQVVGTAEGEHGGGRLESLVGVGAGARVKAHARAGVGEPEGGLKYRRRP